MVHDGRSLGKDYFSRSARSYGSDYSARSAHSLGRGLLTCLGSLHTLVFIHQQTRLTQLLRIPPYRWFTLLRWITRLTWLTLPSRDTQLQRFTLPMRITFTPPGRITQLKRFTSLTGVTRSKRFTLGLRVTRSNRFTQGGKDYSGSKVRSCSAPTVSVSSSALVSVSLLSSSGCAPVQSAGMMYGTSGPMLVTWPSRAMA
jgi:hypothetical protein